MRTMYPEIEPFHSGFIKVSDLHTLYYEEAGNPKGEPVVFLHGGPGGGISANYRRYFDPAFYHVLLFDQRGAGKSIPHAELRENTTWDLVADIEKIRTMLGIDRWLVFGGSWGSTLALTYAIQHPEQVTGLILRGIFLCRKKEIDWFYRGGAAYLFPEAWEKYLKPIPLEEQGDLVQAYYHRLISSDEAVRFEAAKAWSIWEATTSHLYIDQQAIAAYENDYTAEAFARIECHYFIHNTFFTSENYLLEHAHEIAHIPTRIVQGRYDVVCPMTSAWDLKKEMPDADLRVVPDAGHSMFEPGITSELIQASDDFREILKK